MKNTLLTIYLLFSLSISAQTIQSELTRVRQVIEQRTNGKSDLYYMLGYKAQCQEQLTIDRIVLINVNREDDTLRDTINYYKVKNGPPEFYGFRNYYIDTLYRETIPTFDGYLNYRTRQN